MFNALNPRMQAPPADLGRTDAGPVPAPRTIWRGPERRAARAPDQHWLSLILDEIDYAVLLIDARRQVLHANREAAVQLRSISTLQIQQHELLAPHGRDMAVLNTAIDDAVARQLRRMVMIGSGARRIGVAVVPLPPAQQAMQNHVLLLLSRPHLCEALSTHGFARDHGLSGAEGQVLEGLCRGLEPAAIAASQGVAISTVRTQISNIRLKTDAASIRELVARIARLPPVRSALRSEGVAVF